MPGTDMILMAALPRGFRIDNGNCPQFSIRAHVRCRTFGPAARWLIIVVLTLCCNSI